MARYLTTNSLISSVVRRANLPITQVTFKTEDFTQFATEELDMALLPYILSHHEDYYLTSVTIPLEQGVSRYEIPYRAIGAKLNDVAYQNSDGQKFEMTRISKGDTPYYQFGALGNSNQLLKVFYIEGNDIVLVPELKTEVYQSSSLIVSFYIRPNGLVEETRAMTITAIDTATGIISVNSVPTIFAGGKAVDLIKTKSPHNTLAWDVVLSSVDYTANTITVDPASIPHTLKVGDYVCLAEECIIPQIPTDLHSMLAQRIACRCLEALGDQAGLQAANAKLAEMEQKGSTIVDSRVDEAPMKVLNRHGFLRSSRRYVRR